MNTRTSVAYSVYATAVLAVLTLLCQCAPMPTDGTPTSMPSTISSSTLVRIPGITESADTFPCGQGTWNTLRFGVTTEKQLTQWLAESPMVDHPSLSYEVINASIQTFDTYRYTWRIQSEGTYRTSVSLYVISGTLSSLWASFNYPQTLGGVVDLLGEPQSVSIDLDDRYEECIYSYGLYYLQQGIKVGGSIGDNALCERMLEEQYALLEATWPAMDLSCSQGGTVEEVIGAMYRVTSEAASPMAKWLQPWNGFGPQYSILK